MNDLCSRPCLTGENVLLISAHNTTFDLWVNFNTQIQMKNSSHPLKDPNPGSKHPSITGQTVRRLLLFALAFKAEGFWERFARSNTTEPLSRFMAVLHNRHHIGASEFLIPRVQMSDIFNFSV